MEIKDKKILFISPHPDDVEIQCGGLMFMLNKTNSITILTLTDNMISCPTNIKESDFKMEYIDAMNFLKPELYHKCSFPTRSFPQYRQEILDVFVEFSHSYNFDFVFIPPANDFHQDHKVVHEEAIRAFGNSNLISYNTFNTQTNTWNWIVNIPEDLIEKKLKLISFYSSQKFRKALNKDFILSYMKANGIIIGTSWAETYNILRLIYK